MALFGGLTMKNIKGAIAFSSVAMLGIAALGFACNSKIMRLLNASSDTDFSINAFETVKNNPSANVTIITSKNNEITMHTSGLSVDGNNLVLASGGYLEVARDELHPFNNALSGLTSLTTDMVGRIEFSYPDQLYSVDDVINGNYAFPDSVKPSFFKIYNDSENPVQLSYLTINYSCEETTSSIINGAGSFTLSSGIATSTAANTTFTIPIEARKGIVSYSVLVPNESAESFGGMVVGLDYQSEAWWEKTDDDQPSYIFAATSGAGKAAFASMSKNYGWGWCVGNINRHTVHNFTSQDFNDFVVTFDCDSNIYSIYQGNQLVNAAKTARSINGNKFGVRFGDAVGMQIKDIKITLNKDFIAEQPHRFTNTDSTTFYIHRENGSNVYETSTNNVIMWFTREIATTGTITWDHSADGPCTFYTEGLAFSSNAQAAATGSGENKIAIIGSSNSSGLKNGISISGRYCKVSDGTYTQAWVANKQKLAYTSDGTTIHLKVEYDLVNVTFALYYRANENDEWTYHYTYTYDSTTIDYSGMKYVGIRAGYTHNDTSGVFNLKISNLVVNGVAY